MTGYAQMHVWIQRFLRAETVPLCPDKIPLWRLQHRFQLVFRESKSYTFSASHTYGRGQIRPNKRLNRPMKSTTKNAVSSAVKIISPVIIIVAPSARKAGQC